MLQNSAYPDISLNFRRLLLAVALLWGISFHGNAQISISELNKPLLEHKIKALVDSTRKAHDLPPLFNDSILFVASNHHSAYMVQAGKLSHTEEGAKKFYNPQDRANYYGAPASYLVGENVAYTAYNSSVRSKGKTFKTNNYTEIARSLVFSWVNSKGHFKNMINPEYQITGLSIGIDTATQRVYACQKFAKVLYHYSFEEDRDFFPYSDVSQSVVDDLLANAPKDLSYPFKLRFDEKENCNECKETWKEFAPMSVRISRNYFILRVEDADFVKGLIKNRKDGFAIELVPFDAYACGNPLYETEPSRRNGLKRTSGRVLEPVYRNDLLKGFKKRKKVKDLSFVKYLASADSVSFFKRFGRYKLVNFKAEYFEIKLGKVPKDMEAWWNHNLMYIHDKQICHFVYLTNYPGTLDLEMLEVPYYPPVPVDNYEFVLDRFVDTMDLLYAPGEAVTSSDELSKLIQKYQEKNITINEVEIQGFCSVEGDDETNNRLHKQRADKILERLRLFMESEDVYTLTSEIAWDHFYSSVKDSEEWNFLSTKSKAEIKRYLNDPTNQRPLNILAEERKVKVKVTGVRELTKANAMYYINRDLGDLIYKDSRGKTMCKDMDKLQYLYEKAYYFSTVDTISVDEFLGIKISDFGGSISHQLAHDLAFYQYHYLKDSLDKAFVSKLKSKVEYVFNLCGAAEHLSPEFHYLSASFIVDRIERKKNNSVKNPDIEKAFDRLNLLLSWYELDSMFKMDVSKANLNIINILCESIDPDQMYKYSDIINTSLMQIVEYHRKNGKLNPEKVVGLSKLLCYFNNVPLAIDLCNDFLYDNEVLKLYLPLAYIHSSFLSSDEELVFEEYFHALLMEAKERLSSDEWCKLFYGKFGIPFQVMDNKPLHQEFCKTCPNRINQVLEEGEK